MEGKKIKVGTSFANTDLSNQNDIDKVIKEYGIGAMDKDVDYAKDSGNMEAAMHLMDNGADTIDLVDRVEPLIENDFDLDAEDESIATSEHDKAIFNTALKSKCSVAEIIDDNDSNQRNTGISIENDIDLDAEDESIATSEHDKAIFNTALKSKCSVAEIIDDNDSNQRNTGISSPSPTSDIDKLDYNVKDEATNIGAASGIEPSQEDDFNAAINTNPKFPDRATDKGSGRG